MCVCVCVCDGVCMLGVGGIVVFDVVCVWCVYEEVCVLYMCVFVYVWWDECGWPFCDPKGCSPPGSSVHEVSQARTLKWVAISYSRGSLQPSDQTHISYLSWQVAILPPAPPVTSCPGGWDFGGKTAPHVLYSRQLWANLPPSTGSRLSRTPGHKCRSAFPFPQLFDMCMWGTF